MFTGTFGFLLLIIYRKKLINEEKINLAGWLLIFMSLFWLRQIANLFIVVFLYLIKGNFPTSGDEMRLAKSLSIHPWTIQLVTGFLGLLILIKIIHLLPKKIVFTFLLSGIIGGSLGFYLWIIKFGKYILP